jgi:hypothetical protein
MKFVWLFESIQMQWKELNVITLGHRETYNINQITTITE